MAVAAAFVFCAGCGQTEAVKQYRADLQTSTEESNSYDVEYSSVYGPTALSQRPIVDIWYRELKLGACMTTDAGKSDEYKAELHHIGFIEGTRNTKFIRGNGTNFRLRRVGEKPTRDNTSKL
jgi:hypothetical protein